MEKNKFIVKLQLQKKKLKICLIVLLAIALPIFLIGWQGHLLTHIISADTVHGLIWMFALGYLFVPFLFLVSVILAFMLGYTENNRPKKFFYFILGIILFIPAFYTFFDFFD